MEHNIQMSVSPICAKNGVKYAYVSFADGDRQAEGKIPECKIFSNQGFTAEEVQELEHYMKVDICELKRIAAGIHLLDAFMK